MIKLTEAEYQAIKDGIMRKPFDKRLFESGANKMSFGSGIRPEFAETYPSVRRGLTQLREDSAHSLAHLDKHQAACDAQLIAYWRVMMGP